MNNYEKYADNFKKNFENEVTTTTNLYAADLLQATNSLENDILNDDDFKKLLSEVEAQTLEEIGKKFSEHKKELEVRKQALIDSYNQSSLPSKILNNATNLSKKLLNIVTFGRYKNTLSLDNQLSELSISFKKVGESIKLLGRELKIFMNNIVNLGLNENLIVSPELKRVLNKTLTALKKNLGDKKFNEIVNAYSKIAEKNANIIVKELLSKLNKLQIKNEVLTTQLSFVRKIGLVLLVICTLGLALCSYKIKAHTKNLFNNSFNKFFKYFKNNIKMAVIRSEAEKVGKTLKNSSLLLVARILALNTDVSKKYLNAKGFQKLVQTNNRIENSITEPEKSVREAVSANKTQIVDTSQQRSA